MSYDLQAELMLLALICFVMFLSAGRCEMKYEVIFEYTVLGKFRGFGKKRLHFSYRIMMNQDGRCIMQKKGVDAKSWRTTCWGGDPTRHYAHAVCDCRKHAHYWDEVAKPFAIELGKVA